MPHCGTHVDLGADVLSYPQLLTLGQQRSWRQQMEKSLIVVLARLSAPGERVRAPLREGGLGEVGSRSY